MSNKDKRTRSDLPQITDLELKILGVIWWLDGKATVQSIMDAWPDPDQPRYTTILKTLQKMEVKGSVTHTQKGRAYLYAPAFSREAVTEERLGTLRRTLYRGNPTGIVAAFLRDEGLSSEDLDELRRMIDDYERRQL